jgi:hypothetical protein
VTTAIHFSLEAVPSGFHIANLILKIFTPKMRGTYLGAQGDRQIQQNVHVPLGEPRTEIAALPIIIMSENVASQVSYILQIRYI